jgi:hypothetical protein
MKTGVKSSANASQTVIRIPSYGDLAWVQCKGYRCMAFVDATGQWINFYTGEKLKTFVKVIG